MDVIIYNGKTYRRTNSKWVGTDCLAVSETLQIELNKAFIETLDLSAYSVGELIREGDKFKESFSYTSAILFYEKALERSNEQTALLILPRISSCLRLARRSKRVVELFADARSKYGDDRMTPTILTSVAAAYCDLKEYETAHRLCRWAYKLSPGNADQNLMNVFSRIRKEANIE